MISNCPGTSAGKGSKETHTQQVPHLQFHILNQPPDIGNVTRIRLNGQISLNLTGHVTAQVHLTKGISLVSQVQNHCAGKLVVGHAGAVSSLEDVNAVPFARTLGTGGHP